EHRAAERAGENPRQRFALGRVTALVDEHRKRPRRALLVVAVARCDHDTQPDQIDAVGFARLDRPGEGPVADPMRRAATGPSVDPAARAGSVAVAGLEVGAPDAIAHQGTGRPGTHDGAAAAPIARVTNAAPMTGARRYPLGSTFSAKITAATSAIQTRLMTPSANSASISPKQQPTQ